MSSASSSVPRAVSAVEPALPLFAPDGDPDEPLIKLPAAPRPPLAVRKTPDRPRLRAVPRSVPPPPREPEPVLAFDEEKAPEPARASVAAARVMVEEQTASPGARLVAAAIDNAVLFGVDAAVVYLTARMAGLPSGEWMSLPLAPLVAFLLLLKAGYFCAFTAVGGQTIGKMALHLRVVTLDGEPVDGVAAFQRTVIGTISAVLFGLGFLPALLAPDRRGLHDRLTGTRVVSQNPRLLQRAGDVARA